MRGASRASLPSQRLAARKGDQDCGLLVVKPHVGPGAFALNHTKEKAPASLFVLFLALSAIYSAPPVRLKARPFLDSYSNWLYIVPAALGYYAASGRLMPLWAWIAGATWIAGMHALSAVPDIEHDKRAGLKTVAVVLGRRGTLLFVFGNWLAAAVLLTARDALAAPSFVYPAIALYLFAKPSLVEGWYWRFPAINAAMGALAIFYATRHIWTGLL